MSPIPVPRLGSHALFGGDFYTQALGDWQVSWESLGLHRLWCHQTRENARHTVCVVMFNPGSLSGDGKDLAKDTTLRFIRNAMPDTAATLVLNLFTRATPDPVDLLSNWSERDCEKFDITAFQSKKIDALIYAYGDIGQNESKNHRFKSLIQDRIRKVKEVLGKFPQLTLPEILITKKLGNPKHPKHWNILQQIEVVKGELASLLHKDFSADTLADLPIDDG
jgi:Protein of unknown function (DUF1643)